MSIKEKLAKEDGKQIFCYKQGAFWVCYEQSAYIVGLSKGYKPTKKWIKNIEQEVVTIGFPSLALDQWTSENNMVAITNDATLKVFEWSNAFVYNDFVEWKNSLSLKETKQNDIVLSIEKQVRDFPLSNSTPIDAFIFLQKLQLQLQNK